jgi:anthranilate synthase component 2
VHLLQQFNQVQVEVYRNDKISMDAIAAYDKILLSPGPGLPHEAGLMMEIIKNYAPSKPILGICLGHQAIAEAFGGKLYNMTEVLHGVATKAHLVNSEETLFKNIATPFLVGRYHSWAIDKTELPTCIEVTAIDDNGIILAIRHKKLDVKGIQFHPESVLTENGYQIIKNWIES